MYSSVNLSHRDMTYYKEINKMKIKSIVFLFLVFIVSLTFVACGAKKSETATTTTTSAREETKATADKGYKDTVIFAQGADVTSFDPHVGKETPAVAVTSNIYDTLVDVDPVSGELIPQIAESWEQLDELTYRFHIRKGMKFHNGEDLKADDVKFSLERAINSSAVSYLVDFIDSVTIEDEYTVTIKTQSPYAPALRNLAVPYAAIVPKDYVEANPDILKTQPVGSGPYKFVSWSQNDNIKLEAFEDYYAGAPKTKNVIMKIIPEAAQRTIALETGEIDVAYDLTTSDANRVKNEKGLELLEVPSLSCYYISFNMNKTPFDNKLVRQAISYAIDRQLLIDTVNGGSGEAANALVAPAVFGYYNPGELEYNPEKAKELLKEAGYPNGFTCTLWVNNNQSRVEICQAIQAMLMEVGITCKVEVLEFGAFISKTTAGEHDMAYFGWVTSTKDADYTYYSLEHSSQQGAAGNRTFSNDATIDALVEKGRASTDSAERQEVYKELAIYLKDFMNNAPLIYTSLNAGINSKVQGFSLDPIGYHKFDNVQVAK